MIYVLLIMTNMFFYNYSERKTVEICKEINSENCQGKIITQEKNDKADELRYIELVKLEKKYSGN